MHKSISIEKLFVGIFENILEFSKNIPVLSGKYEGWNFNSGNYLFTTDTK